MSNYENGIETKNRILAACRKLFYQKGYNQTTFKDICAEAQVNQSSIHYHFKSKETLLSIIYEETITKNNQEVERFSRNDTLPLTKYFLSTYLYIYKLLQDKSYYQLNLDASSLMGTTHFDAQIQVLASGVYGNSKNIVVLSENEFFNVMALAGFDLSFLIYLSKEDTPKDYRHLTTQTAEIYRRILKIDDELFQKIMSQLAELEAQVQWEQLDTSFEP